MSADSGSGRRPVALVTGAAQGLGRAVVHRLAREGYTVLANDLVADERLASLAEETGAEVAAADVADVERVRELVERASARHGHVDVLVANHAYMAMAPFLEQSPQDWWRHLEVNLSGTFRLVQGVVPGMRAAGGGRIVIVASEAGVIGMRNATGYSASKGGLIALAKSLGRELARDGIITNAVAPSFMDTPQLQVDADDAGISLTEMQRRYAEAIPVGRLARPEEIAAVVAFLAGPGSGSFVGQVLQPNGGTTRTRA